MRCAEEVDRDVFLVADDPAVVRVRRNMEKLAWMQLEHAAAPYVAETYPFQIAGGPPLLIDTSEIIRSIIRDRADRVAASIISARFHNTLAEIMVAVAKIAQVTIVATASEPGTRAIARCRLLNSLSMRAARSTR